MSPDLTDWARAAITLSGWRWLPGMLGFRDPEDLSPTMEGARLPTGAWRVLRVGTESVRADGNAWRQGYRWILPDLADPATAGALVHLLGRNLHATGPLPEGGWEVMAMRNNATLGVRLRGATLGEACVRTALALGCWPGGTP